MMFVTAQHLSVLLLRFLGHELILRGAHDLKWSSCFERVQSDLLSRSPVGLTSAVSILISGENVSRLHTQSPPPPDSCGTLTFAPTGWTWSLSQTSDLLTQPSRADGLIRMERISWMLALCLQLLGFMDEKSWSTVFRLQAATLNDEHF